MNRFDSRVTLPLRDIKERLLERLLLNTNLAALGGEMGQYEVQYPYASVAVDWSPDPPDPTPTAAPPPLTISAGDLTLRVSFFSFAKCEVDIVNGTKGEPDSLAVTLSPVLASATLEIGATGKRYHIEDMGPIVALFKLRNMYTVTRPRAIITMLRSVLSNDILDGVFDDGKSSITGRESLQGVEQLVPEKVDAWSIGFVRYPRNNTCKYAWDSNMNPIALQFYDTYYPGSQSFQDTVTARQFGEFLGDVQYVIAESEQWNARSIMMEYFRSLVLLVDTALAHEFNSVLPGPMEVPGAGLRQDVVDLLRGSHPTIADFADRLLAFRAAATAPGAIDSLPPMFVEDARVGLGGEALCPLTLPLAVMRQSALGSGNGGVLDEPVSYVLEALRRECGIPAVAPPAAEVATKEQAEEITKAYEGFLDDLEAERAGLLQLAADVGASQEIEDVLGTERMGLPSGEDLTRLLTGVTSQFGFLSRASLGWRWKASAHHGVSGSDHGGALVASTECVLSYLLGLTSAGKPFPDLSAALGAGVGAWPSMDELQVVDGTVPSVQLSQLPLAVSSAITYADAVVPMIGYRPLLTDFILHSSADALAEHARELCLPILNRLEDDYNRAINNDESPGTSLEFINEMREQLLSDSPSSVVAAADLVYSRQGEYGHWPRVEDGDGPILIARVGRQFKKSYLKKEGLGSAAMSSYWGGIAGADISTWLESLALKCRDTGVVLGTSISVQGHTHLLWQKVSSDVWAGEREDVVAWARTETENEYTLRYVEGDDPEIEFDLGWDTFGEWMVASIGAMLAAGAFAGLAILGGGPLGYLVGAPFAGELVEAAFVNEARTRYRFRGDPQDLELNGLLATMAFSYCWTLLGNLYPNATDEEEPAGARLGDLLPNGGMLRCPYQLGVVPDLSEPDDMSLLWLPAGSGALPSKGGPHSGVLLLPGQQVAGTVLVAAVNCRAWLLTESNAGRDLDELAAGAFANVDDWAGPALESGFQEEVSAWQSAVWLVVRRGNAGEGPTVVCRLELGRAEPGEVGLPPEPVSSFLSIRTVVYPPNAFWKGVSSQLGLQLLSREWYPAIGKKLGATVLPPTWGTALGITQKGVDVAVLGAAGDIVGQPEWIYKGVACTVVSLPPVSGGSELVEQVLSWAPSETQAEEESNYFVATHRVVPRIAFIACAPGASSSSGQRGVRVLCTAELGGVDELNVAAAWVSLEGTKTISEGPIAAHRRAMAAVLGKRTVDYRPPVEGINVMAPERLADPRPWKLGQPTPHEAAAKRTEMAGPSTRPDLGAISLRESAGPGANIDGHASASDTALSGVQKVVGHAPAVTKSRGPTMAKRLKDLS